jgi:hypothetical protein
MKNLLACRLPVALLVFTLLGLTAPEAEAQLPISDPYIAVFGGQVRTNYARGPLSQDLDWRMGLSAEVGFNMFGLTISPGFMKVGKTEWTTPDGNQTFDLEYSAVYLNFGAREEMGLYFSGGLNWTFWDSLPKSEDPLFPSISADSEIGFQAYLGFLFMLEDFPLKFMIEGGYAQFSGNISTPGVPFELRDLSSTGPLFRVGIALSK